MRNSARDGPAVGDRDGHHPRAEPACTRGANRAVRDTRLKVARQRFEDRRTACQLIDTWRSDVAGWIQQRANGTQYRTIEAASDPRQLRSARHNFDVGAHFVQEGRRLQGALSATDHHY